MNPEQADLSLSPARQDSVPRFETSPYRPDGGCPLTGLLFAASISLAAAMSAAWSVSFIGQWLYLIVFFPLGLGFAVAMAGSFGIRRGKVRNSLCAAVLGFAAGGLAMSAVHFFDYQRFLDAAENVIPGARQIWTDRGNTVFTYVDMAAEEGVHIGKVGHGNDKGMNLGYVGSYIYWGLEVLGVGALALCLMLGAARVPFCSACNSWKVERKLGQVNLPSVVVKQAIASGEIVKLAEADFADIKGCMVIKAAICPHCGEEAPVDVRLEEVTVNAKGEQKSQELLHMTYPGQAIAVLESLAHPAPAIQQAAVQEPPKPPPESGAGESSEGSALPAS